MNKKMLQRVICFILSLTLLCSIFAFSASAASTSLKWDENEEYPYVASTLEDMEKLVGTLNYDDYLEKNKEIWTGIAPTSAPVIKGGITSVYGDAEIVSASEECKNAMSSDPDSWASFGDNADSSVYLPASTDEKLGAPTWQVEVSEEQEGFYYIKIEYYSCKTSESSISSIERKFTIRGSTPFDEVSTIGFDKNWTNWSEANSTVVTEDASGAADSYEVQYVRDGDGYHKIVTEVKDGVRTITTHTITEDINGNSMAPGNNEIPAWNTYYIQDSTGYHTGYFCFYLSEGTHEITLEAEREPMIIKSIEFEIADVEKTQDENESEEDRESPTSYENVLEGWLNAGYGIAENGKIVEIQAEFPDYISDSSVAPTNDNTSPLNSPISSNSQVYNVIGENSYSSVGQWAAYTFRVTEDGLYNLGMRFKQNALQGMFVCRTIKLSGGEYGLADGTPTVPFDEAYNAEFDYSDSWQSTFLGERNKDPFLFHFEPGVEYTLYLECSLGTLKEYIHTVEESLDVINASYLTILQLTGTEPDQNTDYFFMDNMPEVIIHLLEEAIDLMTVKKELEELCGTNGSHIATLETIAVLLNTMAKDEGKKIPENMSTLKSYLGTLGTWINNSKRSSITVDSIWVVPAVENAEGGYAPDYGALPEANANFFQSIGFEIQSFFSSFFVEYDQMGLTTIPDENTPTIDVWLATGRDQSQIWRTMIDAHGSFTDSTGTAVALKLVTAGTLLPSILSGKGPDVYMGLAAADVINYAIRDAVVGISGNAKVKDGWTEEDNAIFSNVYYTYKYDDGTIENTTEYREEDAKYITFTSTPLQTMVDEGNFADAAMDTVTLLDVSYGVPQTMVFAMMFYRMDVLADIGQEVPESWEELLAALPVLQSNNMTIGVNYIDALDFMIYQEGGSMWKYTDDEEYDSIYAGAHIDLDSKIAQRAFEFTCRLYTDYSFPVTYDAANRFRTGEMPIIIGGYTGIYNQLVVYATEIEGMWEFCSLPGSFREDGNGNKTFNYDSLASVTATVILHGCDNLLAAWQFTQWQTGAEAQADYGNRMIALIGPSAKYETANLKAINNLSWTAKEEAAIMNQMTHMSSIVNYPGSYIYTRYMQFAFFDVVNESANAIDALNGYIDAINAEITRKRKEFKDFDLWYEGKGGTDDVVPPTISETESN